MFDFCKLRSNNLTLTQAAAPAVCPCGGFQYNSKGSTALPINETRATTFVPRVRAANLAEVPPKVVTANSLHQEKHISEAERVHHGLRLSSLLS
jgi:hypothetical protein